MLIIMIIELIIIILLIKIYLKLKNRVIKLSSKFLEKDTKTLKISELENRLEKKYEYIENELVRKEVLFKISYIVNGSEEYKDIFDEVISIISELFKSKKGSILLLGDDGKLFIAGSLGIDENIKNKIRIIPGEGIAGKVYEKGEIIYAKDIELDLNMKNKMSYNSNSFASIPIKHGNDIIGVINLSERENNKIFEIDEVNFLKVVGMQLGLVIHNRMLVINKFRKTRLELVGNMAAKIVHEIKNPLNSISGMLQLLQFRLEKLEIINDEKLRKYSEVLKEETNRLKKLSNEILEYTKGIKIEKNEVNLFEFMKDIVYLYDERIVELSYELAENKIVSLDNEKIKEVLINLINNSMEALKKRDDKKIKVRVVKIDSYIEIKIEDNGSGIPKEIIKEIFEPFYTTKSTGTGLGLAICKQIIESHNGYIEVESEVNRGTEFRLYLPI
ncbi:ATP-binding protein [Haliovirga abyssi]|uniref:histidine kinase n=1 Tax=Haliovirga abyssi TaxID=2996794 RepID=A0AAU9D5L9_9FUSO|nr:ATP-binding protein [Haliovirga abyssi]BDU51274.1 hypothetical protein HLVA_18430 [Haliovirga abyssi]